MDKIDAAYGSLANDIAGIKIRLTEAEDAIESISGGGASEEEITAIRQRLNTAEANITALSRQIDKISVGARNLIQNTLYFDVSNWTFDASGGEAIGTYSNATGNAIRIDNTDSNTRMWLGEYPIRYGQTCTVSFKYQVLSGNLDDVNIQIIPLDISGRALAYQSSLGQDVKETCGNGWKWLSAVYTPVAKTESIRFAFRTGEDNQEYTNSFLIKDFQIELGSEASDWNPAPEDIKAKLNAIEDEIDDLDVSTAISDAAEAKRIAGEAKTAAQSAETKAASAETKAGNAETAAANASASASSASQSASSAEQSASSAATSASNAATSASDAASSASSSSRSASNAASSAASAATSAGNAADSASSAATSAANAETSASNAVTAANAANTNAQTAVSTANTANSTANTASQNASDALSAVNNKDSTPTAGSTKLVSSGGVKSALNSNMPKRYVPTLAVSDWTGDGPYTCTKTNADIHTTTAIIATPYDEASAKAMKAGITCSPHEGSVSFSTSVLPTAEIKLILSLQKCYNRSGHFFVPRKGGGDGFEETSAMDVVEGAFTNLVEEPNLLIMTENKIAAVFEGEMASKTLASGANEKCFTVPDGYRPYLKQSATGKYWKSDPGTEYSIDYTIDTNGDVKLINNTYDSISFQKLQLMHIYDRYLPIMHSKFYVSGYSPSNIAFFINDIVIDTVNNRATYKIDFSCSSINFVHNPDFRSFITIPAGLYLGSNTYVSNSTIYTGSGTQYSDTALYIPKNSSTVSIMVYYEDFRGFAFELTTDMYSPYKSQFTSFGRPTNIVYDTNKVEINPNTGKIRFQLDATFSPISVTKNNYGTEIGFVTNETGFKPKTMPTETFTAQALDSSGNTIDVECSIRASSYSSYTYPCAIYVRSIDTSSTATSQNITGLTVDYECDAYGY